MTQAGSPVVLGLFDDLMLAVRVESAVTGLGFTFRPVDCLDALPAELDRARPAALVLDLTAPGFPLAETIAILSAGSQSPPVLAFFPHVMKEVGEAAREAGCAIVVPRSRFMSDLPNLLQRVVRGQPLPSGGQSTAEGD